MKELSSTEILVAEQYCHGLTDKEIAETLGKPVWTIRTHKKHIYSKLSIATTHEIVLYMVSKFLGVSWDIQDIRRRGLAALLTLLMLFRITVVDRTNTYTRGRRVEIECREMEARNGEYE